MFQFRAFTGTVQEVAEAVNQAIMAMPANTNIVAGNCALRGTG